MTVKYDITSASGVSRVTDVDEKLIDEGKPTVPADLVILATLSRNADSVLASLGLNAVTS